MRRIVARESAIARTDAQLLLAARAGGATRSGSSPTARRHFRRSRRTAFARLCARRARRASRWRISSDAPDSTDASLRERKRARAAPGDRALGRGSDSVFVRGPDARPRRRHRKRRDRLHDRGGDRMRSSTAPTFRTGAIEVADDNARRSASPSAAVSFTAISSTPVRSSAATTWSSQTFRTSRPPIFPSRRTRRRSNRARRSTAAPTVWPYTAAHARSLPGIVARRSAHASRSRPANDRRPAALVRAALPRFAVTSRPAITRGSPAT